MPTPQLLTCLEAGERLRKGAMWVAKQCREKKLRASLYGGTWYIPEDAIDEFVEAHMNQAAPVEAAPRQRKSRAAKKAAVGAAP